MTFNYSIKLFDIWFILSYIQTSKRQKISKQRHLTKKYIISFNQTYKFLKFFHNRGAGTQMKTLHNWILFYSLSIDWILISWLGSFIIRKRRRKLSNNSFQWTHKLLEKNKFKYILGPISRQQKNLNDTAFLNWWGNHVYLNTSCLIYETGNIC